MAPLTSVIIVGAGPAGLLLARLLAESAISNLQVRLLERDSKPADDTRAVFYQPVAFYELERAGIADEVRRQAFQPRSVGWRDAADGGKRLFGMPGMGGIMALTLNKLAAIIRKSVEKAGAEEGSDIRILYGHKVVGLGQNESKAWVDVETEQGRSRMESQYVVGCDGGGSIVRKSLFGEKAMPGFTWDHQLVAADIRYDFTPSLPDIDDSNLFMHSEQAWLAFRPSKEENLWRLIYRDVDGLGQDDILARSLTRLKEILPGHPKEGQYEIVRINPYKIHQRLVDKMRLGRVILASDAAHLCAPSGALGLNGGIADVGSLYDCLMAIHEGKADDSILDVYSDVRRDKWKTIIDPQSQAAMRMIFCDPKVALPNHPVFKAAEAMKGNVGQARSNMPDPLALRYDFSPHFRGEI